MVSVWYIVTNSFTSVSVSETGGYSPSCKAVSKYPPLFTFRSVTKIVTIVSVQKKVVLLQCIDNQISQWRLAVRNIRKAKFIKSLDHKGLVHKFQGYCSHASKCLQLRHGALYKASRHHHDVPLYSRNKNGIVCSWYFLLGK